MAPIERPIQSNVTARVMSRIHHAELLTSVYGAWPDFHDSEITSVTLDRGNHMTIVETNDWKGRIAPSLTARVIVFDYRGANAASRKYRLATLRFSGINALYMENFGYQNPVMGIGLRAEPEVGDAEFHLVVEWGGTVMGHEAKFTCESIDVLSVEPLLRGRASEG